MRTRHSTVIGVAIGVSLLWISIVRAAPGGVKQCQNNLNTCTAQLGLCTDNFDTCSDDLTTCQTDLAACEAAPDFASPATGQDRTVVAGEDGNPAFGAPLSYTDNGDGTITDNNTGLEWEKKIQVGGGGSAANLNDADNMYPWRGSCSTSGAECGTDADCPSGQTCDAGDGQTASPNGLTIFEWVAALNAANFGGHNDWRIPNVKELQDLIHYGTHSPAIDRAFLGTSCGAACADLTDPACSCIAPSAYWSATTYTQFTPPGSPTGTNAWGVSFNGSSDVNPEVKTAFLHVRAVRGGS